MKDTSGGTSMRPVRRLVRVAGGFIRPSTRATYVEIVRQRIGGARSQGPLETCLVCGSPAAKVVTVRDTTAAGRALAEPRIFHMRICGVCGHVGNPENTFDYRDYDRIDHLTEAGRIGTMDRPGREFHMARMAIDILGRDDLEVLIYGAGRSYDNHHIAALPQVRGVAIADIMQLRDDAEFIDAAQPAPRRFAVVVASEVVEHFLDPRPDFARLFGFVEPDGLLVCSTNLYDGGRLSTQSYIYVRGHVSYYTPDSLARIAAENGVVLDLRIPWSATGYAGPRKRYLLFTRSAAVVEATARYFSTREYAPSESPTANVELTRRRTSPRPRRAKPSDQAAEQLVRQEPAAGRQDDALVGRDIEQLGGQRPAEGIGQRRLMGRGQRDATVGAQAEDDGLGGGGGSGR